MRYFLLWAYSEAFQLLDRCVLIAYAKQAAHSISGRCQLLPQAYELPKAGLNKIWDSQQAQRVPCWCCVEHYSCETRVVLALHKLNHL